MNMRMRDESRDEFNTLCLMRLTYKLTASEYVAANYLHWRRNPLLFLVDVFNYIAAPLLGLMLIFGNAIEIRRHGLTVSSILGLLPPIAITLIPLWIHLYLHYRFKSSRVSDGPCLN